MRNLKKFLALVLALMMVMSVMVTVSAKTSYTDDDKIDANYSEAIEVLSKIGVLQGRGEAGSSAFDPKGTLSRAEAAKIVSYMLLGSDAEGLPTAAVYSDVPTTFWGNKFVNYASLKEIIDPANDKFRPGDKVTGYEFGKMVLVAAGFDPDEYTNNNLWYLNVAEDVKIVSDESGFKLNAGDLSEKSITREAAAQLAFSVLNYSIGETRWTVFIDYNKDGLYTEALDEEIIYSGTDYNKAMLYAQSTGAVVKAEPQTLAYDVFGLEYDADDMDDWGRPVRTWSIPSLAKTLKQYPATPVAKYTTAVSECDVVDAYPSLKDVKVISYYVDGVSTAATSFSTGSDNVIDDLGVREYIGAQGLVTEIYKITGGYRVVQINTYLAQVTKVTPSVLDANNHPSKRTIDVTVYYNRNGAPVTASVAGVESESFAQGDYILVNVLETKNDAAKSLPVATLKNLTASPVVAVGSVTTWTPASYPTPATTTVGATKLNEAVHFYLNKHVANTWTAMGDGMGNVIGMVQAATNYTVIEAIAWIHNGLRGGYVAADLVMPDGTRAENVTIATINGVKPVNNDKFGALRTAPTPSEVSDSTTSNANAYYYKPFGYSKNEDGSYNLAQVAVKTTDAFGSTGVIDNAQALVYDDFATANGQYDGTAEYLGTTTENTVFMVYNALTGTYSVIKGKNAMPSMVGCKISLVANTDGYATLVVVQGRQSGNTFVGMVLNTADDGTAGVGTVYRVYKVGESAPTTVYQVNDGTNYWSSYVNSTGLYTFQVDNQGVLKAAAVPVSGVTDTATTTVNVAPAAGPTAYATNVGIYTGYSGMTFVGAGYGTVTANDVLGGALTAAQMSGTQTQFNLRADAKVFLVTKSGTTEGDFAVMREGTFADITKGSGAIVIYDKVGAGNYVNAVYVLSLDTTLVPPASSGISYTGAFTTVSVNTSGELNASLTLTAAGGDVETGKTVSFKYAVEYMLPSTGQFVPLIAATAMPTGNNFTTTGGAATEAVSITGGFNLSAILAPGNQYRVTVTATLPGNVTVTSTPALFTL